MDSSLIYSSVSICDRGRERSASGGAGRGLVEDLLLETAYQTAGTDAEEAIVKPFLAEDRFY